MLFRSIIFPKSRVLLGKIIATPSNLLLLDEPTNHLDMDSIDSLMDSIEVFSGAILLVTHDEEILKKLCTRLIVFQGDKPFVFEGGYESFLDRIGWEEEGPPPLVKKVKKEAPVKEPKKKSIKSIEDKILRLEAEQKTLSLESPTEALKWYELQGEIDKLYEELE